ncbi:MAG: hypothetical protein JWP20_1329 [Roseomonas sp.]|jgi:predicted O-methyltransferase YrrM|nr:hypothetical protein [Roseomonas sp.]
MLVQEQLLRLYAERGYAVRTGCGLAGGGDMLAEFTSLWSAGQRLEHDWAPSLAELSVLEMLSQVWSPERIFCIGTGFGWTMMALRLFLPKAFLTGIDPGAGGGDPLAGIRLTNEMLLAAGGGEVIHGRSPDAVPAAVENLLDGSVNLAFINTREAAQQERDFRAVQPYLARDHVVLFHGVRFSNVMDGFHAIAKPYADRAAVLDRTTSGIGILYSPTMKYRMERLRSVFAQGALVP